MIISDVRACQPRCESPPDWRTSLGQILVAVKTEAGLTGYGVGGGGAAGIHIVRTILRDLLVGKDFEQIARHWQAMYAATLPFGRKGVAIMAISGVDLALWDLLGKSGGKSVAQLLGGPIHENIPLYATVWDEIPDESHRPLLGVQDSSRSQKRAGSASLGGRGRQSTNTRGPDVTLMVDAWMKWDVPFTLQFAELANPYQLDWIEEPLPPDDFAGYAELVKSSLIPIAGGEHEFTAAAFIELIDKKLHHIVQPDACWCGGMTQLAAIYKHANQAGVRVCPHRAPNFGACTRSRHWIQSRWRKRGGRG